MSIEKLPFDMRSTIVSKRKELITICLSIDRVSVLSGASGRSKTTSQLEAASKLPWYRGVTCKDIKDITPTVLILLGMFYWAFKKNNFYCNSTHDKYLGKSKGEVGIVWRRLLFNHF